MGQDRGIGSYFHLCYMTFRPRKLKHVRIYVGNHLIQLRFGVFAGLAQGLVSRFQRQTSLSS